MPLDKTILSSLANLGIGKTASIQKFVFSTLYNSIPDDFFNSTFNNIINTALRQNPTIINGSLYESIKQLQFKHSIFQPCTPQSQVI